MGVCCDAGLIQHCGWAATDCCNILENNITIQIGSECVTGQHLLNVYGGVVVVCLLISIAALIYLYLLKRKK